MSRKPREFQKRYGPWALVAGASEGLGAEFARQLAARGLSVVLLSRRAEPLEALAAELMQRYSVKARVAVVDLAAADLEAQLKAATADLEIGLLVYNAAHSGLGEFLDQELASQLRSIEVNCRGPVILSHVLGRQMAARRRGGIILMGSLASGQGVPLVATYAATKAFDLILAEGLWEELRHLGIDVVGCRAGATRTPGYERSRPQSGDGIVGETGPVVRAALQALGRQPTIIPGFVNGLAAFFLGRLLPRRAAVSFMGKTMRSMYRT